MAATTATTATTSKEELLDAWWAKWREADFTWEGLAKDKPLQGWVVVDGVLRESESGRAYGQPIPETATPVSGRKANLQDYWRADPATGRLRDDAAMGNELVRVEGQPTYHVCHLPLEYADGTKTGKADWKGDALDALVNPRLLAASETVWEGPELARKITGPDRDAQLQGGVWLKAAAHPRGPEHALSIRHNLALINGYCDFARMRFSGAARFQSAAFSGDAWFESAAFSGLARFESAKFAGNMDFTSAVFSNLASFETLTWPDAAAHWHAAFDQVLFKGTASFTSSKRTGFRSFAAFDGATFERGLQFDASVEAEDKRQFEKELRAAKAAAKTDGAEFKKENKEATGKEVRDHIKAQREVRLQELERGCRVLKLAFEKAADKTREQLLYRFELQARRVQRKLPAGEALFSDLYALSADYGASMVRPFMALGVLLVAFAAAFYGLADLRGLTSANAIEDAWQAFDFSLANVFKPLSALSEDAAVRGSLAEKLLTRAGYGWTTGVRALAITQSILAIVLAFLFALSVRRRFQIS